MSSSRSSSDHFFVGGKETFDQPICRVRCSMCSRRCGFVWAWFMTTTGVSSTRGSRTGVSCGVS